MRSSWGAFLVLLSFVLPFFAEADSPWHSYYGSQSYSYGSDGFGSNNYGGFSSYSSREPFQVLSINLDPKARLDGSFRIAAREDRLSDLVRFKEMGADINSKSDKGVTALMYASRNCSEKTVSELIHLGVDVNLVDQRHRSALIYAVQEGCVPAVKQLCGVPGIKLDLKDDEKKSVFDYAEVSPEVIPILNDAKVSARKLAKSHRTGKIKRLL